MDQAHFHSPHETCKINSTWKSLVLKRPSKASYDEAINQNNWFEGVWGGARIKDISTSLGFRKPIILFNKGKLDHHTIVPTQLLDLCLCDSWCNPCLENMDQASTSSSYELFPKKRFLQNLKNHSTLITFATILPYKIFMSWSNSPHCSGGTKTIQHAYSFFFFIPTITKARNNASSKSQFPLYADS